MATPTQYNVQFDLAKNIMTLDRMHMCIMARAVAKQDSVAPSPSLQVTRESLLAYEVLRNPERWSRLFSQALLAKFSTVDPDSITDAQLDANVDTIWPAMSGVVDETPVPLPS